MWITWRRARALNPDAGTTTLRLWTTRHRCPPAGICSWTSAGAGLRVSWHPERDLVVLSVWQGDRCVGTFRMPVRDVPRLSGLLAAALGDWVGQADAGRAELPPGGARGGGGGTGDLTVQQRLRLSRPVLRLRGLQHRRRRPPPGPF
jgi:hypothetical protein